jgi:hypothetical protein
MPVWLARLLSLVGYVPEAIRDAKAVVRAGEELAEDLGLLEDQGEPQPLPWTDVTERARLARCAGHETEPGCGPAPTPKPQPDTPLPPRPPPPRRR